MEQDNNVTPNLDGGEQETFQVKVGTDSNGEPIMEEVSRDEVLNWYLRQSDYTRKTQELADEKKMLETGKAQPQSEDDQAINDYLNNQGYATTDKVNDVVEKKLKAIQDQNTISTLIASNPDLKQFEWAIKKLATIEPNKAIEDIVAENGFASKDKLAKAKQRWLVGWSTVDDGQPKPIDDWTKEDWAKFEANANKSQFR